MSLLQAHAVAAGYGRRTILEDVSLSFRSGAITVLAGPNGAGKSTLLNVLCGDLAPVRGRVELCGADISRQPPYELAERRAVLPQSSALSFPYTVYEIVRLGLRDQSDRALTDRNVQAVLEEADLAGYGGRRFQELSGGEQQRVHIARVLAQLIPVGGRSPQVLFLDEPTASLDLRHQYRTMDIARRFARKGGVAVVVLHDLNLAAAHADNLIMLANGSVLAAGSPAQTLTPEILEQAYGAAPRVGHDAHGIPFILPPIETGQAGR